MKFRAMDEFHLLIFLLIDQIEWRSENKSIVIAALSFVDAIVIFGEDTPYELIDIIQPDILVKGGGYDETNMVGADIVKSKGGKVVAIDLIEGYSTTNIINSISKK